MFEDIIQQWQDNSLNLADYGLDFIPAPLSAPLSRMDLGSMLSGSAPTTFQNNLLKGIEFLQYRIDRSRDNDDRITKVSHTKRDIFHTFPFFKWIHSWWIATGAKRHECSTIVSNFLSYILANLAFPFYTLRHV